MFKRFVENPHPLSGNKKIKTDKPLNIINIKSDT